MNAPYFYPWSWQKNDSTMAFMKTGQERTFGDFREQRSDRGDGDGGGGTEDTAGVPFGPEPTVELVEPVPEDRQQQVEALQCAVSQLQQNLDPEREPKYPDDLPNQSQRERPETTADARAALDQGETPPTVFRWPVAGLNVDAARRSTSRNTYGTRAGRPKT